ncbi:MAG: hypothetical protein ABJ383_11650 [Balneola sp.]
MEENSETKQLLGKIEHLIGLTKDDLTNSVLEIETLTESTKNYDALRRIHKSLTQYIEKKRELVYIGFMGHFSSGKSSTINSLLNLAGNDAREVDLHPSDKAISLITHPDNEPSFVKLVSYGNIPIKPVFVEHEFLKHIVFVDTPGAGDTDPLIIGELMQDYLPICDLLLYFLSATNPLDENDLPLLKSKEETLSLIPTKYIITRADEFKRDFDLPISDSNYDQIQAQRFIAKAKARIEEVIDLIKISNDDFIILDNKKLYNVDQLVKVIDDFSSLDNLENKIRMHEYKVRLFRNNGIKIKNKFLNHATTKLKTLNSYRDEAKSNKEKYENKVKITNNKLTETWRRYQSDIAKIKDKNIKDLAEPEKMDFSNSVWTEPRVKEQKTKIQSSYNTFKTTPIENYYSTFIESVFEQIRIPIENLRSEFANLDLRNFDSLSYKINDFQVSEIPLLQIDFSSFVNDEINKIQILLRSILRDYLIEIRSNNNSLNHRLLNHQPISQFLEIIDEGKIGLSSDLDTHFDHVYLYRQGVFAEHVKEYISKLGIGDKLSQLENEFKDEFKDQIKNKAMDIVFPECENRSITYKTALDNLKKEFDPLNSELGTIDISSTDFDTIDTQSIIKESSNELNSILTESINQRLRYKIQSTVKEIEQEIKTVRDSYKDKLRELRKKRFTYFGLFIIISASIVLPFSIFTYLNMKNSMANSFIISISANFVLPIISFVIAKLTDKFPEKIKSEQEKAYNKISETCNQILNKSLREIRDNEDEKKLIDKRFQEALNKQLEDIKSQPFSRKSEETHQKLLANHQRALEIRKSYKERIMSIATDYSAYFDYDDGIKLDKISKEIKEEAIEPSFTFLDELKTKITSVKSSIDEIEFT